MKHYAKILIIAIVALFIASLSFAADQKLKGDEKGKTASEVKSDKACSEKKDGSCAKAEDAKSEKCCDSKDKKCCSSDDKEACKGNQAKCPVKGEPINKDIFKEVDGQKVYFCCEECKAEFEKDPQKYLSKMEKDGVKCEKCCASDCKEKCCDKKAKCDEKACSSDKSKEKCEDKAKDK